MKITDIQGKRVALEDARKGIKYYCADCTKPVKLLESVMYGKKFIKYCYCE